MKSDDLKKIDTILARRGLSRDGTSAAKRQRLSDDLLRSALEDEPPAAAALQLTPSRGNRPVGDGGASTSTSGADDDAPCAKCPVRDVSFNPSLILQDMRSLCRKDVSSWTATEVRPIIEVQKGCAYMNGSGENSEASRYYTSKFSSKFEDYMDLHPEVVKELDPVYIIPIFPVGAQEMPAAYDIAIGAYLAAPAASSRPPLPPTVHGNLNVRVLSSAEDGAFFAGWVTGQAGAPRHLMITTRAPGNCVML